MKHGTRILRVTSIAAAASMLLSVMAPAAEAAVTTLLAPKSGEHVFGRNVEVAVGYNTQSAQEVTELQLWVDGVKTASKVLVDPVSRGVCSFWWDCAKVAPGPHNLAVKVFVGNDLIGTARGSATVGKASFDLNPPAVKFVNLKAGQVVQGKLPIRIASSDDSGDAPVVSLLVDNALKLLSNTRPFSYELDTTQYADGEHEIKLVAFDTSGNKSEGAAVKVNFKNGMEQTAIALPKPAAQPTRTAASEDDFAPKIPPAASLSANAAASAARAASIERAPQAAVARPLATAKVKQSSLTRMAMAPVTAEKLRALPMPDSLPQVVVDRPAQALASRSVDKPAKDLLKALTVPAPQPNSAPEVKISRAVAALPAPSLEPVAPPASSAAPIEAKSPRPAKPVQVAMRLSSDTEKPMGLEQRATSRRDTTAKLEQRTIPTGGKVKLRDLVEQLGGVLLWDSQNRFVTARLPGLEIQMEIGSQLVKVNGTSVGVDSPPVVVDGRTVIDAQVYHLAVHVAGYGGVNMACAR